MERESCTYTCPKCRRRNRCLADEYGDHGCSCGWEPEDNENETEGDAMNFTPAVERSINGGTQKVYVFPNGYGASVVKHAYSYGGSSGLWELAVLTIKDADNPLDFELTYDTPITSDVIGHLDDDEVDETLTQISELGAVN